MKKMNQFKKYLVAGGASLAGASAMAAPTTIDITEVTAQITSGATAIAGIGVAVLAIYGLAKCFQLVKKAF